MRKVLSETAQSQVFSKILAREENNKCSDCGSSQPNWYSLNFGTIICYNCSGEHRNLGLHITRVISTKLDCWTAEEVAVAEGVGNQRANFYWEANKPHSVAQITATSSAAERRNYIREKYLKKPWVRKGLPDPYTAVMEGTIEKFYSPQEPVSPVKSEEPNKKVAV